MIRWLRWTATRQAADALSSIATTAVFALLDILDALLCYIYALLDALFEGKAGSTISCYCYEKREGTEDSCRTSQTLHDRGNQWRKLLMGAEEFLGLKNRSTGKGGGKEAPVKQGGDSEVKGGRWSDCNCESCVSWEREDEGKLHVVAEKSTLHPLEKAEAVIFLHGFQSSSSLWTETVFPNLSESAKANYLFFAVDLLGFGDSPKPRDSLYRLEDHVEMIERSVIQQFNLDSFHLVAHSMGCIIALALASKYSSSTKSITLVAPPYFSASSGEKASRIMMNRLAGKRLWPFLSFGSSVMTWYEHIGRTICFIVCRNHRTWERVFKFLTRKRWVGRKIDNAIVLLLHLRKPTPVVIELLLFFFSNYGKSQSPSGVRREISFLIRDMTKHTHHSAWHTMHNVICKGAEYLDSYLQDIRTAGIPILVVHGSKDQIVPLDCSFHIKSAIPFADVRTIPGANHGTVIVGREIHFTREIEATWDASRVRNQDLRT
ncbi:Haloalkane dehalogenase [Nymphaea thermarum]|nr:Haloalkane dehalogenase [Nymphaea thermarum]